MIDNKVLQIFNETIASINQSPKQTCFDVAGSIASKIMQLAPTDTLVRMLYILGNGMGIRIDDVSLGTKHCAVGYMDQVLDPFLSKEPIGYAAYKSRFPDNVIFLDLEY